jgi:hypothetical protein
MARTAVPARAANRADVVPPPGTLRQGEHRLVPGGCLALRGRDRGEPLRARRAAIGAARRLEHVAGAALALRPHPLLAPLREVLEAPFHERPVYARGRPGPRPQRRPGLLHGPAVRSAISRHYRASKDKPRRDVVEHAQHQPEERAPVAASVAARNSSDAGISSRSAHAGPGPEASLPSVSCICPTYNRPPHHQHLLELAIASFIGDKQNAAVGLARGELIAPWDDDDISLPWRLSLSVERLGDGDYFNSRCYWFLDNEGLNCDHSMGYANNASLFRRAAFEGSAAIPQRV